MRDKGMSSKEASKEEIPHNLKPKSIEDTAVKIMEDNNIA
jgi:hypothetical protein